MDEIEKTESVSDNRKTILKSYINKILPSNHLVYFTSPVENFSLIALFICFNIYQIATIEYPYPYAVIVATSVILSSIAFLCRVSRWKVYTILLVAVVLRMFIFVHIVATGENDAQGVRDLHVEITTQSLLRGNNAWNAQIGGDVTTGPTSILLAVPFVILFGNINWLSTIFWILVFITTIVFDVQHQNNTWPIVAMVCILGLFDIEHTMYWALEELYYPFLYLVLAYLLVGRKHWWVIGGLLAAAVLTRTSYTIVVTGFGLWLYFRSPLTARDVLKTAAGFIITSIILVLPFIIVGGPDVFITNPWATALRLSGHTWPESNFLFHILNQVNANVGSETMRYIKIGLVLVILVGTAWILRRAGLDHPFWHMAIAGLLAHLQFSSPHYRMTIH